MRTSSARVVEARHWIEFVRSLKDDAVADLESTEEQLGDSAKAMRATNRAAQALLDRNRLKRAQDRLREAKKQRAAVRALLLLDDEEPDGQS